MPPRKITDRASGILDPMATERQRLNAKTREYLTNPFVRRDGSLSNPYINYQKVLNQSEVAPGVAEKISRATGLTPSRVSGTDADVVNGYNRWKARQNTEETPAAQMGTAGSGGKATYNVQKFSVSKAGADYVNKNSPFSGYSITSYTGARNTGIKGASTFHAGIDRAVPEGTAVSVPINTTFYRSGSDSARGNWIELKDANGNIMHYQHLQSFAVGYKPGDRIGAGTTFAISGSTGVGRPHLHEEYYTPDGSVNITESYWNSYAPLR